MSKRILITSLFGQISGDLRSDRGCGAAGLATLLTEAGHTPVFLVKKVTAARKRVADKRGWEYITHLDVQDSEVDIDRVILYATSLNMFGGKFDSHCAKTIEVVYNLMHFYGVPMEFFLEDGRESCSWYGPISGMQRCLESSVYADGVVHCSKEAVDFFQSLPHPDVIFPRSKEAYVEWASIFPWHEPHVACRMMPNYETRISLWRDNAVEKGHFDPSTYKWENDAEFDLTYVGAWRDGERVEALNRFAAEAEMLVGGTCYKNQQHHNITVHPRRVSENSLGSFLQRGRGQLITGNEYLTHMQPVHRYLQALACENVPIIDSKWDPTCLTVGKNTSFRGLYAEDGREACLIMRHLSGPKFREALRDEFNLIYAESINGWLESADSLF